MKTRECGFHRVFERHQRNFVKQTTAVQLVLPSWSDSRGDLCFLESGQDIPIQVQRLFYLCDMGRSVPGFALRTTELFVIALNGRFELTLTDGTGAQAFMLETAHQGGYIPTMTWLELRDAEAGSVSLFLASQQFEETDYCRDYALYVNEISR